MGSKQIISSIYSQIRAKILMSGPITVAEYMRMALTKQQTLIPGQNILQPSAPGYYMSRDVFGQKGDFITSPEISQMFGEMIAVWGITAWREIGGPPNISIVELGPGRGTLAKDMIRVFQQLKLIESSKVSLHLIEISPYLAQLQVENLCGLQSNNTSKLVNFTNENSYNNIIDPFKEPNLKDGKTYYHHGITKEGNVPVFWYRDVTSLPKDFYLYIAHEFFDALPIHKLQKVNNSWREVLIDLDTNNECEKKVEKLRFIISRHETPTVNIIRNYYELLLLNDNRNHLEISLDAIKIYEELINRLNENGGIGLIIDYGHDDGIKEDTFRGFYKHKVQHPLLNPGTMDLTADIDFSHIIKLCKEKILICGPINQKDLLQCCGIDSRLQILQKSCKNEDDKKNLISGYNMLMNDMGERFKCLALFPKILQDFRPKLKITAFDDKSKKK